MAFIPKRYKFLSKYASPVQIPNRKILGRDKEVAQIEDILDSPEISNAILLGPAGVGKTSIVEELARRDPNYLYVQVNLDQMASSEGLGSGSGSVEMASRMIGLKNDAEAYQVEAMHQKKLESIGKAKKDPNKPDRMIVLFMDEFHKIESLSKSAAQAIKPMLAHSGVVHVKVIAATTFKEFNQYVLPDKALEERFNRVTIGPPDNHVTKLILENMKATDAPDAVASRNIYDQIIRVSNQDIIGDVQPRKSIKILNDMIGAHNRTGAALDGHLLAKMMYRDNGIRVDWNIDVNHIEDYINSRIIDQRSAAYILSQNLYTSVAGLNDEDRPQGSFLFTGATGVGKTEMAKALTHELLGDEHKMIRFDMANYAEASSLDSFRYELTQRVTNHPNWVVLFDEIEKANPAVTRMLLPVLDDGELADKYDETVSFRNTYIIMTTNAARTVYQNIQPLIDTERSIKSHDKGQRREQLGQWADKYRRLIRDALTNSKQFPPELIGRLDDYIPFNPLSTYALKEIALLNLRQFYNRVYRKFGIRLHYDRNVITYLVDENRDTSTKAGGARAVKRKISTNIRNKVAELICQMPHIRDISVKAVGNMMTTNIHSRISGAYILVSPWRPSNYNSHSRVSRNQYLKSQQRRQAV